MNLLTLSQAYDKILNTNGKMFSAVFIKKDGSDRHMVARLGVQKNLKGKGLNYNPRSYGLLNVFDMHKDAYRMININALKSIQIDKTVYIIKG